jgi:phytoene dehydrogenase-like protein
VDWERRRDEVVARMEARIDQLAPGFTERILARHVQTPADLERRNANLVHGDVGAGSYSFDQLLLRPVPSLAPYRTPLRGLYLGSASTFPGGAVHGVPGHAAARLALTEARIRPGGR